MGLPPSFRARGSAWFFSPVCALEVNGAEGGSVTFHLQDLKGEKLAWSFNGDTMLTITLGESLNPSFFENAYKSRVTFPNNGSSLTISQLGKKDAGTYTAKNSVYKASFTLRVHSVLREPEVTCVSWNCSADGCRYVLRCAVHTPGVTSFVWSHGEQLDAEEPELVVEKELPPGELDVLPRTCTVRNPVSSRNVTVSPAAVCTGESPQRIQGWGLGDTGRDGMHPDPSWVPLRLSESRGSAAPPGVGGFAEALTSLPCPCSLPHAALPENTTHSAATGELPCCPVHIHVLSPCHRVPEPALPAPGCPDPALEAGEPEAGAVHLFLQLVGGGGISRLSGHPQHPCTVSAT
uniref:Uncharacterized protein n=1 Tax=Cairina moschata TaxID=8855 RepID=A0A8C3C1M9_CAIMO